MEKATERKNLVKELRAFARQTGATQVRDDSSRTRVEAMFQSIVAKAAGDTKSKVTELFEKYQSSFKVEPVSLPDQSVATETFRLRGRSFLFTYNWDFFHKALPDGTRALADNASLWKLWQGWEQVVVRNLGVTQYTSTLERSLQSATTDRVHFHFKVNLKTALDQVGTAGWEFHGVRPDGRHTAVPVRADTKKARGASFQEASDRAHFYAWAPKRGTLFSSTNWQPWANYRVLGKWLDDLWTDGKLTNDSYDELARKVKLGYSNRKRDLEVVRTAEREEHVNNTLAAVNEDLAKLRAPFRTFPQVTTWENTFLNLQFRWKVLVLVADSAAGKSSFAESLFQNPCVVTVEEAENLDLKSFDRDVHDGLVLDNVNSWGQLLLWRAVLQARNAKSKGGQSATNVYSYTQYLFGVPVVATVDLDAPDAHLVDTTSPSCSNWLCKNTVRVALARGETFYDSSFVRAPVANRFSLFAETLKRRRATQATNASV